MAWYVVHVGRVPVIYLTWKDCYAQVNRYLGNLYKKYNIEAKALRAYYGARSANHGHQPTLEIEEKPPAGDMMISELLLGLVKMSCFYLWLWSLLFLFGS